MLANFETHEPAYALHVDQLLVWFHPHKAFCGYAAIFSCADVGAVVHASAAQANAVLLNKCFANRTRHPLTFLERAEPEVLLDDRVLFDRRSFFV